MQESKHEVERRSESLRREIDMLTQDKNFLREKEHSCRTRARGLRTSLTVLSKGSWKPRNRLKSTWTEF